MGFEEPARTYRLVFEDPDFAGAEVVCRRRVPMRVYLQMAAAEGKRDSAAVQAALHLFGDQVLESWNVLHDGQPLPADGEGMLDISPEFSMLILASWLAAVAEVPSPLGPASSDGGTSGKATTLTATASISPGN